MEDLVIQGTYQKAAALLFGPLFETLLDDAADSLRVQVKLTGHDFFATSNTSSRSIFSRC